MLKVALVGVGGISGAHIPAWEKREDAELVAICDIRSEQMFLTFVSLHIFTLIFL